MMLCDESPEEAVWKDQTFTVGAWKRRKVAKCHYRKGCRQLAIAPRVKYLRYDKGQHFCAMLTSWRSITWTIGHGTNVVSNLAPGF
jgi:hypothetical protein